VPGLFTPVLWTFGRFIETFLTSKEIFLHNGDLRPAQIGQMMLAQLATADGRIQTVTRANQRT
jgi:hypothetical protein